MSDTDLKRNILTYLPHNESLCFTNVNVDCYPQGALNLSLGVVRILFLFFVVAVRTTTYTEYVLTSSSRTSRAKPTRLTGRLKSFQSISFFKFHRRRNRIRVGVEIVSDVLVVDYLSIEKQFYNFMLHMYFNINCMHI